MFLIETFDLKVLSCLVTNCSSIPLSRIGRVVVSAPRAYSTRIFEMPILMLARLVADR